ncbi:MAG TPA: glucoamylase family protein, partial [Candidatus Xenobia bacterium]
MIADKKVVERLANVPRKLDRWLSWGHPHTPPATSDEAPLRADLYNVEQLERFARTLADRHSLETQARSVRPTRDKLIPRLRQNEKILEQTYHLVTAALGQDRSMVPAAEWLLDNFYLVEEQIQTARRHLPPAYCRDLPHLAQGEFAGYPRVYALALPLIAHVDGKVDPVGLNAYIAAYQSSLPLVLGELWAVPIMLRLALIENLRRVALRVAAAHRDRLVATEWAERMIGTVDEKPTDLILVMADMVRANPPFSGAFLAELAHHLHGQSPYFAFARSWLEHRVAEQGMTVEQLVRIEGQAQAADQVSMGNSITSLRLLSSTDWESFVESHSTVEQILRHDPAGVYPRMDFETRDRYRHEVEAISRRGPRSEPEVAGLAVDLARAGGDPPDRRTHVGYFLIDGGRTTLEAAAGMGSTWLSRVDRTVRRHPLAFYLTAVLALTAGPTFAYLDVARHLGMSLDVLLCLALPVLFCAGHAAVAVVNWLVTALVRPRPLPRLDYREGIPAGDRTMVVIPTMLSSPSGVADLLSALEVRYLCNKDRHLHFALLTDLADAPDEVMPADAGLVQMARDGIEHLNATYRQDVFFLFHRPRRWNPRDHLWMGYERKRGKLADLNSRLRKGPGPFLVEVGQTDILAQVRYVITLDTDTQLPAEAAHGMVSAMAHPLNRPLFDDRHRVMAGYTILQPRVGVTLPSSQSSRFARLFAGDSGIDPYTRVVSDVYQDLFGEGTFIGKGIYDVDAFERCCGGFPDNTILSHDLLESAYARSGLLSDVILYEDFPSMYAADVSRRHRWIRGDWQIAGWLLPRVPGGLSNPLSSLSQWKILDNLRRSLVPVAVLLLLLLSWLWVGALAGWTAGFVLATLGAVPLASVLGTLVRRPAEVPWTSHLRMTTAAVRKELSQFVLLLVLLPSDALMSIDAVGRTVGRMVWTRRRLLEWKTSHEANRSAPGDLLGSVRAMGAAPILGCTTLVYGWLFCPTAMGWATPLLVGWISSPLIMWWLSRPLVARKVKLDDGQLEFLGRVARRTWRFFEDYVTAEENWLPPDNVQRNPQVTVAGRTSPTNVGMGLLAELAAVDFGYCSATRMVDRVERTLATLARLERYRGHLFNWYDTRTLSPLVPRYVSTVDSGNLVGHLLVLSRGLMDLGNTPILGPHVVAGFQDTVRVLAEVSGAAPKLVEAVAAVARLLAVPPQTLRDWADLLSRLKTEAGLLVALAEGSPAEVSAWARALAGQAADHQSHLLAVAPWVALGTPPPDLPELDRVPTWRGHATRSAAPIEWQAAVAAGTAWGAQRLQAVQELIERAQALAHADFSFLYDGSRELFAIGYNVDHDRLDASYYDLLASESRLGSFVCIAQGQVRQDHWFALGRRLTSIHHGATLLSWSGTMFEYLMPLLVMPVYPQTLLEQTYRGVVERQIEYGRQRGVPWGISESGYNLVDQQRNYQYRAFGVPGLALKRGLAEDVVVAPYATALALMVAPEAACKNLERLAAEGRLGPCGFDEAVDYTPSRLPPGAKAVAVQQVMAHHAGMTLLSLAYLRWDRPMQRRFAADPMLRSALPLLQERVPQDLAVVHPHAAEARSQPLESGDSSYRVFTDPGGPAPEVHLLSNGRYHVMVTSAGSGYSRWGDVALTRWREDATEDGCGTFCYLRDLDSGSYWSTAWQPTVRATAGYEAIFSQSRAEFRRRDEDIDCHTEIAVSPEDDIELRRMTLINRSDRVRRVEVTSYAEVVLAPLSNDLSHRAFSNMFVQTELIPDRQTIFCTRRPRSNDEHPPWMMHLMTVSVCDCEPPSFETNRLRFVGRGRTLQAPQAMSGSGRLSGTDGAVLDPVVAIRQVLRLKPNETVRVDVITGAAASRDALVVLSDTYRDTRLADRVFELSWMHSQIVLQQLHASEAEAQAYGRLAGSVLYASARRRAPATELLRNHLGQSALWKHGISGDLPIVLVRIGDRRGLDLVRQALQAHGWWRIKGVAVDLVIWNEDASGYLQSLHDSLQDLVSSSPAATLLDRPGGIFIRRVEQMSDEDRVLLLTVARVVLQDDAGTLLEQVEGRRPVELLMPALRPTLRRTEPKVEVEVPKRDVALFNGLGGFSHDGKEYVMMLSAGRPTPAPWVNVIASPGCGTVVSESGSAYTWTENSHEFRLTPWKNDAVTDSSGEALYIRDEETGRFWSPTPLPAPGPMTYVARHGFGYSVFEYTEDGITSELWLFVAMDAPVKFTRLKITNRSGRARRLSVTGYWEWVLGELRQQSLMHVVTEIDPLSGSMLARQPYNPEFGDRVAFVDCSESIRTVTGDRTEFIGRNGNLTQPRAMRQARLSGRVGAGLDPATGMQVMMTLEDGLDKEVVFILGAGRDDAEVRNLASRYRTLEGCRDALDGVWRYWSRTLGTVHVETPDVGFNFLANGWLLYQILSCRMWGRTGFYQSGGAYGFRDQLQDAMALVHAEPGLLREHLLRAAGRQFTEGDVQHWWHPPMGRGVRSHCSDDYLWLPYATCRYVQSTGDTGLLDERVPFLTARAVREDEEGYYDLPQVTGEVATLYDHCLRAVRHSARRGAHGLPLMGSGDWNDGMNRIGMRGQGESVWLGFFLHDVLTRFGGLARQRGDDASAATLQAEATLLRQRLNDSAWDGEWYLRAWFDDGTPVGTRTA